MIQTLREWKFVGSMVGLSKSVFKSALISGCAMSEDPKDRCITSVSVEVCQLSSRMCSAFTWVGNGRERRTKPLNPEFCNRVSDIMGRSYDEAEIMSSSVYSIRGCKSGNPYSSFNMGTGEDVLIHLMHILQECPDGSLIVIEEIELGFHPEALIRLAKHLQEIILKKKLQAIVSTHSPQFIDNVPREARLLIQRSGKEHTVIMQPTTRFALAYMAGQVDPELQINTAKTTLQPS